MRTLQFVALLGACLGIQSSHCLFAAEPAVPQPAPEKALALLQQGNTRFVADRMADRSSFPTQRAKLAAAQHPFAIVLTCSDSRVPPEFIFNQQLGDLFFVRVAGNVTDPVVLGSIEYAVEHFHSPIIVVLGHSSCGAVQAAVEHVQAEDNLGDLVKRVKIGDNLPADPKQAVETAVKFNALEQTHFVTEQSKVLKKHVEKGSVRVIPAVYSLQTGQVEWLPAPGEAKKK